MIKNIKIAKVNRLANGVAHEIAKFSFISRSDGILLNSVPPCVANLVMNDYNNLLINIWGVFKKIKERITRRNWY